MTSGRLATVELKAQPAAVQTKTPGAAKGSWGKPAPKAKVQEASADGIKTYLSEGTSGFEIPIKSNMFESAPL
jgi:glutamyl-tRNA synthetase